MVTHHEKKSGTTNALDGHAAFADARGSSAEFYDANVAPETTKVGDDLRDYVDLAFNNKFAMGT